jgi:dCMP deaminase
MDNVCEGVDGETLWHVIHAEANAICKLAAKGGGSKGSTAYLTLSPCRECSKLMLQSGIVRIVYSDAHSDTSGIDMLSAQGVEVLRIEVV